MNSVLQKEKECFICGTTIDLHSHHILYGKNRKKSEQHGLKVWLCSYHHNMSDSSVHMNPNGEIDAMLKQTAQRYYEEHIGDRLKFMQEFGRNYLD